MLASDAVVHSNDGRFVQFISWQAVVLAGVVIAAIWLSPETRMSFLYGCLAVVLPNVAIAFGMRKAGPGAAVFYSMVRWLVVSMAVACAFVALSPMANQFFIGVGLGVFVIVLVPVATELWRMHNQTDEQIS